MSFYDTSFAKDVLLEGEIITEDKDRRANDTLRLQMSTSLRDRTSTRSLLKNKVNHHIAVSVLEAVGRLIAGRFDVTLSALSALANVLLLTKLVCG